MIFMMPMPPTTNEMAAMAASTVTMTLISVVIMLRISDMLTMTYASFVL